MAQHKTISPWFESVPDKSRFPKLQESITADIAVIGGGIVGVLAAWECAKRGADVVVLEKNHIAAADTGYTTAFLTRVPDTSLSKLVDRYGVGEVRSVYRVAKSAQEKLFALIREESISCDFVQCSSYEGSYTMDDPNFEREWPVVQKVASDATVVGGEDLNIKSIFARAMMFPNEGRFNVRKFLFGLLRRPTGKKIRVFEGSGVGRVKENGSITLSTKEGNVKANKIVVATSDPIPAFALPKVKLHRKMTYVLKANVRAEQLPDNLYWDSRDPYFYFRHFNTRSILLGGVDHTVGKKPKGMAPKERLQAFLKDRFGTKATITHEWPGMLLETDDGLPIVDWHPSYKGRVGVVTGLAGNGMVMGAMAAGHIAEMVVNASQQQVLPLSLQRFKE